MTLCRCRLLRCASLGVYEAGPGVRIEDCLLDTANGLAVEAKDARVEMHNGACVNLGVLFSVYGGTEIRLSRNSIFMAKLASVVPVEPARPTRFHLSDNAFAATTVLSGWPAMFLGSKRKLECARRMARTRKRICRPVRSAGFFYP